jgi:hypothetical protein
MPTDTAKRLPIARCACLLAAAVTALAGWPGAATAADDALYTVTPTISYRGGGRLEERDTADGRSADAKRATGVILNLQQEPDRLYELYYSRQDTRIRGSDVRLRVDYLQIGGLLRWQHPGFSHFLAGGIGATRLEARGNGSGSDLSPSLSLALGLEIPLVGPLHLRLEGRGHATFTGDDSGVFCVISGEQSGCVFGYRGGAFTQIEASAGLGMRF